MSTPYDYYPAVLYAIDLLSQGATKTKACDEANINVGTFDGYISRDPQLAAMLSEAEQRGHDAMADALVNPFNDLRYGETDVQKAKVVSENIKWLLARRDGARFGDKVEVKHSLTLDVAITSALNAAKDRVVALAAPAEEVIDAEFVRVDEVTMADLL